ncbi:MAG: hypothetical protein HKM91_01235 [Altererythrobacter sp.]|uniref:hypothetical protein n=1 Tax=uncultured Altererythrobacter sp. TaxID=500840 RepID=UPI00181A6A11|nr:hypothetical protein [uncultured Altererythrobacter sp.]MBT8388731.1 hypothetical protein [Altererythrobacter sp.]NNE49558.1 hypothetical protein [Altererythrobacter sp.]NNF93205.1 hypothetical protein [Altererythrobacter sp.]
MRIAVSIVVLAALSACEPATPPSKEETAEIVEEAAISIMQPGLYSVGDETTDYGTTRLNEDGTYIDYDEDDKVVGGGTWRTTGELLCFDPEGNAEEEQENCWTNEPDGDDGSFRTTRDDGSQNYLVTPIAEEANDASTAAAE